jgi:hypothetical protein
VPVYFVLKNIRTAGVKNTGDAIKRLSWKIGIMECWSNGKKNQPNTPSLHHSPRDEIFNGP